MRSSTLMSRFAGRVMRTGEDGRAVPEETSSSSADALDEHVHLHSSSPSTSNSSSVPRLPPRGAQKQSRSASRFQPRVGVPQQQQQQQMGDALNEKLVKKPCDQLFFSRKARPVSNFQPYTLDQYRLVKSEKYYELGKLQPDLHRDDLVEKRKNADRVREFSRKLRMVNAEDVRHHKPPVAGKQRLQHQPVSKRQKALEFAKNHIPKPKVMTHPPNPPPHPKRVVTGGGRGEKYGGSVDGEDDEFFVQPAATVRRSRLEELEAKHDQMRGLADDIRRRFSAYS